MAPTSGCRALSTALTQQTSAFQHYFIEREQYCAELKADNLAAQSAFNEVAAALRVERAQWARERREWNELMQEFFGNGQKPKYNGLNMYGDFGSR